MNYQLPQTAITAIEKIVNDAAQRQRANMSDLNSILFTIAKDPKIEPRECADRLRNNMGISMSSDDVIRTLKKFNFTPANKRLAMFKKAAEYASKIITYLQMKNASLNDIAELECSLTDTDIKKLVLITLYNLAPGLHNGSSFDSMLKLNRGFSAGCTEEILCYLKESAENTTESADESDGYKREIHRLESELNRANRLFVKLQDEFDERIEEMRKEQEENVIALLNSEKYGGILDLLTSLNIGLKKLRRDGILIPLEIASLPTLVRQIMRFVADCNIEPICEIGKELTISVDDLENYSYRGTPFMGNDDKKHVTVISTGWRNKESETIISLPVAQEKE